ncbi:polysaccharide export protein [Thiohalophilus sp.]|uniref:polysaccharide export protein n=1 Tax=Thiohalophilus sp. TaxID=3028392 RepID=UPI002ACD967D|nr:polysaccharide export protein [Thiohalophilus sp.]MDZ7662787.1 polysaccharide export protein [Thiohalophilus sp.]
MTRKLIVLFSLVLLLSGCAAAPGMYMDDSDLQSKDTVTEPAIEPELIPITPTLVRKQASARAESGRRQGAVANVEQQGEFEYHVGPGDVLNITVWEHPELTIPAGEFRDPEQAGHLVSTKGTIFYPYAGELAVAGKTLDEIRSLLQSKLTHYIQNPQVGVRVAAFRSKRAFVTGEVNQPSVLPITDTPLTLLEAINRSGGASEIADLRNVVLSRGERSQRVDLLELYRGDQRQPLYLRDGDQVYVPDHFDNKVFVLGEVNKQSAQLMRNSRMTLAEAISGVEGLNQSSADPSRIYVIRGNLEKPRVYQLNAESPDALLLATMFELQPRDVIYVSIAGISRWNRLMSQILPTVQTLWQTDRLIND